MKQITYICILVVLAAVAVDNSLGLGGKRSQPYIVKRWFSLDGYSETPYDDCGSVGSTLKKVEVIPCDSEDRCILHRGADSTFKLSFVSKVNSTKLNTVVHGIVAGIPLPFHVPQANACKKSGIECPLKEGELYNYELKLPVLPSYPTVSVKVRWELKDDKRKDVVCVEIPAKLE